MDKLTRAQFNQYAQDVKGLNHTDSISEPFAIEPEVETSLETQIQESSAFLKAINITGVINQKGRKLGLGATSSIAGRTNTDVNDRTTSDPTGMEDDDYECRQTNFDTHLAYGKLDTWRHHSDFASRYADVIVKQIGRDRQMIGFNGTSSAAETNRATNPLLEDVNEGWLHKIREYKKTAEGAPHYMSGVEFGADKEHKTLDALVFDARNNMIKPAFRTDTNLVLILGSNLWTDKFLSLLNDAKAPTEGVAADLLVSKGQIGGLRPVQVPFFPENSFLITSMDNLSIYYQEGTRRRFVQDNPKRDRVEDYQSVNESYVVELFAKTALVELATT